MLIADLTLTPEFSSWLTAHSDSVDNPMVGAQLGRDVSVTRSDASEPSEGEAVEALALAAAHRDEPLRARA